MARKNPTRRQLRQQKVEMENILNKHFTMKRILPKTATQSRFFESYKNGYNIANIGSAGTGKTYISLALALAEIMETDNYEKILIVRSAVQSRDQGFMPGSLTEKMSYYESPYVDIVNDLFGRKDAYNILKQKGQIEFMSTSFVRGLTFDRTIIIVDEIQNMQYSELRTIITRYGEGSRIILCGDTKQDDLKTAKNRLDRSGLDDLLKVITKMKSFDVIKFTTNDIVRSEFIKEFIITEEKVLDYV